MLTWRIPPVGWDPVHRYRIHSYTLPYPALHWPTLPYTALHLYTLPYTALRCNTLLYTALQFYTQLYTAYSAIHNYIQQNISFKYTLIALKIHVNIDWVNIKNNWWHMESNLGTKNTPSYQRKTFFYFLNLDSFLLLINLVANSSSRPYLSKYLRYFPTSLGCVTPVPLMIL